MSYDPGPRVPQKDAVAEKIAGYVLRFRIFKAKKSMQEPSPVRWYDRAWAWANGKKLWAGAAMLIAGGVVQFIPGANAAGWVAIGKGFVAIGSGLASVGALHKLLKWSPIGPAGVTTNKDLMEFTIKAAIKILLLCYEIVKAWNKAKKK
jgi:hypothetical protein